MISTDKSSPNGQAKPKSKNAERQADALAKSAREGAKLVHTPDGEAYAIMHVHGHREVWRLRSKQFRSWLAERYYRKHKRVPSAQGMADAMTALEGMAVHEGDEREVYVRVAEHGGAVYLDLGDAAWRAVEATADGWRIVTDVPVLFRRPKAMRPLPEPVHGGDVGELRRFANVNDAEWPLVVAWLMAALYPRGPYPLLCLFGEAGSGKTWLARLLRALVDANASPVRCEPREVRDLAVSAGNAWVVAFDNLSHLTPWLSDALCRLSTGGGFSTRTLYENDEETIFDSQRPVILTSIEEVVSRGDLLERSILVSLVPISEHARRPESALLADFNAASGRILGGLLDALSTALVRLPGVRLERLPRMADFAKLAVAAEPALGLADGEVLSAYFGNRASGNELALEASPIGRLLADMARERGEWRGTAAELLAELEAVAEERMCRLPSWPKSPRVLAGTLKRLSPHLRAVGVEVESGRDMRRRWVTLRKKQENTVISVMNVMEPENTGFFDDASREPSVIEPSFCVMHDANDDANDASLGHDDAKNAANDADDANDDTALLSSVDEAGEGDGFNRFLTAAGKVVSLAELNRRVGGTDFQG